MKAMTLDIVQILFSSVAFFVIVVNDINCRNHELSEEQKIISFLLEKEKSQYDQTKKIIERINTREHDLRQQMNNLSETQKEELNEIESSRISKFATENQSIDIMLSEHAYLCSQKNIELICSVHGELLQFMKPHHIASIFSNALTNAENYLDTVPEKEKKIIRVSLNKANGNIILVFQNYLKDQVRFSKGLPITTIPTYSLITDPFTNWRGMSDSGGRRISRSFVIDADSVQFCTPEMLTRFKQFQLVSRYVTDKEAEIEKYNKDNNVDTSSLVNGRRHSLMVSSLMEFRA